MAATSADVPTTKPRWYAPTPAKSLFAVLVMQGVLFLSAHYRWFWFNERKGYTVLITVAATAIGLLLLAGAVVVSRFFKSKSQFSLATLLLIVPVMAIPCAWLARGIEQARQQRDVVKLAARIETAPSGVSENWVTDILGPDFFRDVTVLTFPHQINPAVGNDAYLAQLRGFTKLRTLNLRRTPVTDTGLEHLKGLTQLESLNLDETLVTDAGLEHLKGLTQLKWFHLDRTRVTDTGLEHLKGHTQMQWLYLRKTQVTAAGVDQLRVALPNSKVVR